MDTLAIVFEQPRRLALRRFELAPPAESDVVVDVEFTGISTGTERLLWTGRMPAFPGMGYPLVPGYETIGRVTHAGPASGRVVGERVFVGGARCFGIRALFGGAASRLVVGGDRAVPLCDGAASSGVLLALAATAHHAAWGSGGGVPDLIVGHGALGRLLARLTLAVEGEAPTVWETDASRRAGEHAYPVVHPDDDPRRDYRAIYDMSGDASLLDALIARLAPRGEVCLAGFYTQPLSFHPTPAFLREARMRVAAEWDATDLTTVAALVARGALSLDGLITHHVPADDAALAYDIAFSDPGCVKMVLDWRNSA